jgi:hypothetical protein
MPVVARRIRQDQPPGERVAVNDVGDLDIGVIGVTEADDGADGDGGSGQSAGIHEVAS